MKLAVRITPYWGYIFKRTWRGSAITSFVMPALFLGAMGVGLGGYVDKGSGAHTLGGVSYLDFIGPGLLATTTMQIAVGQSMFPVMSAFKWDKSYHSMAATPLTVSDILTAHLGFVASRVFAACTVFVIVLGLFGTLHSWTGSIIAVLAIPLLALAYATPLFALSASLSEPDGFSLVHRLGLIPMFLFSGAFFPVSQLPSAVAWIAYVTPIWHGVQLDRALTLGSASLWPSVGHVAYLLVWIVGGFVVARRMFLRRLAS